MAERVMFAAAEAVRTALADLRGGRTMAHESILVRVGLELASATRERNEMLVQSRFGCSSNAQGAFVLPPSTARRLVGVDGELEFRFEQTDNRGYVRVCAAGRVLLEHRATDARLRNAGAPPRQLTCAGTPVRAGVLALLLRAAEELPESECRREPSHSVVHIGALRGRPGAGAMACDDHSGVIVEIEALGTPAMQVPVKCLSSVMAFLRGTEWVYVDAHPPAYIVSDGARRAIAWRASVSPLPLIAPPLAGLSTLLVERTLLLAAIDRLLEQQQESSARTLLECSTGTLRLTDVRRGICEVVCVERTTLTSEFRTSVSLRRLRRLCDVAGRQVALHLGPQMLVAVEEQHFSSTGRTVRKANPSTSSLRIYRLMAPMLQ